MRNHLHINNSSFNFLQKSLNQILFTFITKIQHIILIIGFENLISGFIRSSNS